MTSKKLEIRSPRTPNSNLKSPLSTSTTETPKNHFLQKNTSSHRITLTSPTAQAFQKFPKDQYFFPNTTRKDDAYNLSKEYNPTNMTNNSMSRDIFNRTTVQSTMVSPRNLHSAGGASPIRFGKSLPMLQLPLVSSTPVYTEGNMGSGSPGSAGSSNRDGARAMRDVDYKKQEGELKKNPHVMKFTNYLEAL